MADGKNDGIKVEIRLGLRSMEPSGSYFVSVRVHSALGHIQLPKRVPLIAGGSPSARHSFPRPQALYNATLARG